MVQDALQEIVGIFPGAPSKSGVQKRGQVLLFA
jgi:hypothetical protein